MLDHGGGKKRKLPMRRCVGCGQSFPKKDLVRLVRESGGEQSDNENAAPRVTLDFTSKKAGRGVYVCRNLTCFRKARKARRFEQHLSCGIPPELYEQLEAELEKEDHGKTG